MGVQGPEVWKAEELDDMSRGKLTLPEKPQIVEIPTMPTDRRSPASRVGPER